MTSASITPRPIPMASAAVAAMAALAFAGLTVLHDDTPPAPVRHSTIVDSCRKHAGRLQAPATVVGPSCAKAMSQS
jgi:hypothetical protein